MLSDPPRPSPPLDRVPGSYGNIGIGPSNLAGAPGPSLKRPCVLLTTPWDQTHGGVASVVHNLADHFSREGGRAFVFTPGESKTMRSKTTRAGFPGFEMSLPGLSGGRRIGLASSLAWLSRLPLATRRLHRLLRDLGVDVVNIHYPSEGFFPFALCRKTMPIRLVVSIHGADLFPKGERLESYPLPLRWLLDASDAIVAPSHAFRDDLLRVFPKHSWKAMTIHNGLPVDHLRGETSSFEIPLRGRFALCIAQHNEKKALHVLIEAFAGIAAEVPDVFLVIAGDGPRFEANRRLVETLRMAERIRLLGDVPRDAIRALCRGCELGVLPSISEPFGIALLEIMACGKAVVASRTGGIPEIVRDGEEGLLVPPGDVAELADALRTLLANPAKAARLGGRGRERVEMQFLASHNAERYGALFASLLGGVGERAGASSTSADTSRSPGR